MLGAEVDLARAAVGEDEHAVFATEHEPPRGDVREPVRDELSALPAPDDLHDGERVVVGPGEVGDEALDAGVIPELLFAPLRRALVAAARLVFPRRRRCDDLPREACDRLFVRTEHGLQVTVLLPALVREIHQATGVAGVALADDVCDRGR